MGKPLNKEKIKREVDHMKQKRERVVQICSRTVKIAKEEMRPAVNFCIAAASAPMEVLNKKRKQQRKTA